MPRLHHSVEPILAKLREAEVALSRGQPVAQVCRTLSITEQTYGMNYCIANYLRPFGRQRCWWSVGDRPRTGFVPIVRLAIVRPLQTPWCRVVRASHSCWYNYRGRVKLAVRS